MRARSALLEALGGQAGCSTSSAEFYARVGKDPVLRPFFRICPNARRAWLRHMKTPLGRLGRVTDIAPLAVFLASDESSWITGEVIRAAGGLVVAA